MQANVFVMSLHEFTLPSLGKFDRCVKRGFLLLRYLLMIDPHEGGSYVKLRKRSIIKGMMTRFLRMSSVL